MTIASEDRKAGPFPGDGVTVNFDFTFKVFAQTDVLVIQAVTATGAETEKTITTDYTVTLNPNQEASPGGRVTMLAAPPVGQTITLTSEVPNLQGKTITSLGGFFPQVLNDALDRLTILVQQVRRDVARSVKVNISSASTPDQLLSDINASVNASSANAMAAAASEINAAASASSASSSASSAAASAAQAAALVASANDYKASVRAATVGTNITLAGGAPNTLDGVTLAANDRILVKDQTTASQNGIYYVTTLGTGANGTWTRATDADGAGELTPGAVVAVEEGATLADSIWELATDGTITIGTTALTFVRKDANINSRGLFYKTDTLSVAFTKTGAGTISVKAGTVIDVFGVTLNLAAAMAVAMPALSAGTDYAIYACQDGTVRADSSFTNPTGYTTANSRLIGGFHYGLVAPGTTVAGGSFNTAGSVQTGGMVWTQTDVDKIAGINQYSLWDLKWRANVSDLRAQKGFVLTDAGNWVAIYFASTGTDANGLSKYNSDVASGTVLAKIPTTMGGNGTITYADGNWWRFSELARAYGARLLTDAEANIAFFGVTENQSLGGGSTTIPLTTRQAGYTSKYGVEQATGHHWTWGDDSSGTTATAYVANGGRGQSYANSTMKVILGGGRDGATDSGSRTSIWNFAPAASYWSVGLRAACDHLMLA